MKKTIKLVLAIVVVFLLVRLCTSNFGSVINLPEGFPGGLGESSSTTTGSNESGGGWFSPKSNKTVTDDDTPKDYRIGLPDVVGTAFDVCIEVV